MFVAVYRWRLKEGQEGRFREGWRRLTEELARERGGLGSRLHRADDGEWVAYAQWPDRRAWEAGASGEVADAEAVALMRESVEVSHPAVLLEVAEDLLRHESAPDAAARQNPIAPAARAHRIF